MKIEIKLTDLAVAFDRATEQAKIDKAPTPKYICNFIRDDLLRLPQSLPFTECADALRVILARHLQLAPAAHFYRTIPGWFAFHEEYSEENPKPKHYFKTIGGNRLDAPEPFKFANETRSFFLNYLAAQEPETILSFEI